MRSVGLRWFVVAIFIVSGVLSFESEAGERPPANDCLANLNRCLLTKLGDRNPRTPGKTFCASCFDYCKGQKQWPEQLANGIDCRWWNQR